MIFDPFADLNREANVPRDACRNGIALADLAATAFTVFFGCAPGEPLRWNQMRDVDKDLWIEAVSAEVAVIDIPDGEQAAVEISAKGLAKMLYMQFTAKFATEPWNELPYDNKLAWEAVARHVANVVEADLAVVNFKDFEERAIEWFTNKSQLVPA